MREHLSRQWLIARRWLRVLSAAPLAFALMFVTGRIAHDKLDDLASVPTWGLLAVAGAIGSLAIALTPSQLVAALRLKHVRTYPPYWFGVAAGVGVALFVMTNTRSIATDFQLKPDTTATLSYWSGFIAFTPLALLTLAFVGIPFRTRGAKNPTIAATAVKTPDLSKLLEWVVNDTAIIEPAQDLFGHSSIAATMARRLVQNDLSPQAVVGALGSGKTTIGKLVEKYVSDATPEPPISFISIELWPYATPRAAVEGILRALTNAFSTEINTSQLKGLPEAYGTAIAKLAGVSEWIPAVLRSEPLAESEILESFDDIAIAIGRRFVLWVEDLERFGGGDPDSLPTPTELERLAPIRALLLGLGRLRAITVITVSTDLLRRFDVEKIAAYTETVPTISLLDARHVIGGLRKQWWESAKVIDAAPILVRRQLGWDENHEKNPLTDWLGLGDHVTDFAAAVAALASTPRTLKQGLRAAQDLWKRQTGEIDLDDVIALSVLRESHPNVFALVDKKIHSLRGEYIRNDREKHPIARLKEEINEIGYDERTALAIDTILSNLFGAEARPRPQSVSKHGHADYWARFTDREAAPKNESDQEALRILSGADDAPLIDLLVNERTAANVEDFARILKPERIAGLLSKLVERLTTIGIAKWGDRHAPGLVPLWRMIRDHIGSIDLAKLEANLDASLESVAPRNLALLADLVYLFVTPSRELADIFDAKSRERLIAKSQALLVRHYENKPEALVAQLRDAPAHLLLQACYGFERIGRHQLGKPFDDWSAIASTVLAALPLEPETIAPQLSALITKENPRAGGLDQWVFDKAQCEALFGDPKSITDKLRSALTGKRIDGRSEVAIDLRTETHDHEPAGNEDVDNKEPENLDASPDEEEEVVEDGDNHPDRDDDADSTGAQDGTATSEPQGVRDETESAP